MARRLGYGPQEHGHTWHWLAVCHHPASDLSSLIGYRNSYPGREAGFNEDLVPIRTVISFGLAASSSALIDDGFHILAIRRFCTQLPVSRGQTRVRPFDFLLGFSFRQVVAASHQRDGNIGDRARTSASNLDIDCWCLRDLN